MSPELRRRLREHPLLRPWRLARLRRIAETDGHPDWPALIGRDWGQWQQALAAARDGPGVLIATGIGGHLGMSAMDSLLAVALTLRGAAVRVLLCDQALPACQIAEASWFPDPRRFAAEGPQALPRPPPWSARSASPWSATATI